MDDLGNDLQLNLYIATTNVQSGKPNGSGNAILGDLWFFIPLISSKSLGDTPADFNMELKRYPFASSSMSEKSFPNWGLLSPIPWVPSWISKV